MKSLVSLCSLSVFLLVAHGQALGQAKCGDLPAAAQAKCKAEVDRQCAGVTGYWPKRRCEEKVAGGMDVCNSAETNRRCADLKNDYAQVCQKLGQNVTSAGIAQWLALFKSYPAVMQRAKAFEATANQCKKCIREIRECKEAGAQAKTNWVTHLNWFRNEHLKPRWENLAAFERNKRYTDAQGTAQSILKEIREKLALNQTPEIQTDTQALAAEVPRLEKKIKDLEVKVAAELAKVRCPVKGAPTGAFVQLIHERLKQHNASATETVKRFGLHGRVSVTYHGVLKNVVRENQEAIACVHRVEGPKTDCFFLYAKLSRQKEKSERKWGPWVLEHFHHSTPMLCKNLR